MSEPQTQFRGCFIPAEMMRLFYERKINSSELLLLATIDSFVSEKKGCWASNEYLADRLGVEVRNLQYMLAKLKRLGLIKQVSFDGKRRYLETVYSRVSRAMQKIAWQPCKKLHGDNNTLKGIIKRESGDQRSPSTKGKPMPFFPDERKTKKVQPSDFDLDTATTLHQIVVTRRKRRLKWSRLSWADEIRILRQELNNDQMRITRAMEWYGKHAGEKGVPPIESGKSLRKLFTWLEDAMARSQDSIVDLVIEEAAKRVARTVGRKYWPAGAKEKLETAAQLSINNHRDLVKQLKELELDDVPEKKLTLVRGAVKKIINRLGDPEHFAEQWLFNVNKRVENWEQWSGSLNTMVFSSHTKPFQRWGRAVTTDYCGDANIFDYVMELLRA